MNEISTLIKRKLKLVRAVVLDVDGVLTDGGMYYSENGEVMKKFNARDGMGIYLLQKAGIKVAIVTSEETEFAKKRAKKLNIEDVHTGAIDKIKSVDKFLAKYGFSYDDVAYIGDDLNDLPVMEKALIAIAVNDAQEEVKAQAHITLTKKGGEGAVREFVNLLLKNL